MALYDSSEEAPPGLWACGWETEKTGYSPIAEHVQRGADTALSSSPTIRSEGELLAMSGRLLYSDFLR